MKKVSDGEKPFMDTRFWCRCCKHENKPGRQTDRWAEGFAGNMFVFKDILLTQGNYPFLRLQ